MIDENHILVVEDNDFVRMQIVKFLNEAGFKTAEASEGQEALETINDKTIAAIVDVRMEPMGGFEFIKAIRSKDKNTPVVLVTGDQDPELLNDASKWDVAAVLMKPVKKDRLVMMMERVTGTRNK